MAGSEIEHARTVAVLAYLNAHGPAPVTVIAEHLFGAEGDEVARGRAYQLAYNACRTLESQGAATRERVQNPHSPHRRDEWSAVPGAEVRAVPERRMPMYRTIRLRERWWEMLLGVLNDACIDDPSDIDLRKLRNIVKSATRTGGPIATAEEVAHADAVQ